MSRHCVIAASARSPGKASIAARIAGAPSTWRDRVAPLSRKTSAKRLAHAIDPPNRTASPASACGPGTSDTGRI